MSTSTLKPARPFGMEMTPEMEEETKAVLDKVMHGIPMDPAIYQRIRENARKISEEVYRKHGLLDIAVPSIRALRDGDEE